MTRQVPEAGRAGVPEAGRAGVPGPPDRTRGDAGPAGTGRPVAGPADSGPADTRPADAGWPPEGEGQLPFSLRIGVTGHRRLADPEALLPVVRAAIQGVIERFLGPGAEPA